VNGVFRLGFCTVAYRVDITEKARVTMTMQEYYSYQFHYRPDQPNPYLSYGMLSSQAKVDA
jgi:hypothetical protein